MASRSDHPKESQLLKVGDIYEGRNNLEDTPRDEGVEYLRGQKTREEPQREPVQVFSNRVFSKP
eukprot:1195539-Prorocentrum_minimum.AAC.14